MTAPPGEAAAGTGNGAEKKKFFPKKFGGVGMYIEFKESLELCLECIESFKPQVNDNHIIL